MEIFTYHTVWPRNWVWFLMWADIHLFFSVQTCFRAQPPIQRASEAPSSETKWFQHEADHSPPTSGEVKNAWSYTSTQPFSFMAWCLLKHRDRDNFMSVYLPHSIRVHISDSCQDGTADLREVCHIWCVGCHFLECVTAIHMVCTNFCNQL
jgi:hypothetical protein